MSVKRRAVVGLAGLALAGGTCLTGVTAAPTAGAASVACASSCVSLYNQKFGSADVSAVSGGGTAATGQAITLAAAAPSTTEDWKVVLDINVAEFNTLAPGILSPTVVANYGSDTAYEWEYTPGGADSALCLGIASGPTHGTKVTLQPCGQTAKTVWIGDDAHASGGYEPFVSGTDAKYPAPYVLTAVKVGGNFTTNALAVTKGVVAKDQMWQLVSGVLGV